MTEAERVDQLFEAWNNQESPGCAVAVIRDGDVVYKHGFGMANLAHGIAIGPSTVFHSASVSKQFTAFAILLLSSEGKLSLDDAVRKYVPTYLISARRSRCDICSTIPAASAIIGNCCPSQAGVTPRT
jgi:CubicO group peptidase (beta-lactamase class C family)